MTAGIKRRESLMGYSLAFPIFLLIFVVIGFPFLWTVYLSLTNKTIGYEPKFIGLKNYILNFSDPDYWLVLKNTLIYMTSSVFFKLFIGMVLAIVLNQKFPGRALVRILLLLPWALPGMVSAMAWKWMYNDTYGIINALLKRGGFIQEGIPWLSGFGIALFSVIIVNIWRGIPFFLFSLLGGLQTIDPELYDVARIDGAGPFQSFFRITIPSLAPVIAVTTMLSSIWTFNDFENVFLITGGGPLNASAVISTYTYQVAFQQNDMARSLSVAVSIIPILVLLIAIASRRIGEQD